MRRLCTLALAGTALSLSACMTDPVGPATAIPETAVVQEDRLAGGFADPPDQARPRVWWHWMNGNITQDGIAKDLAWMERVGIGGFHNFDAALGGSEVVEHRLAYMTDEWKDAFRFTASEAARLGLELGIATSPGFSVTGGPWVPAEDGLKKLVWGETRLEGGASFTGRINRAPTVTGPYQAMRAGPSALAPAESQSSQLPAASDQIAVIAVPVIDSLLPMPRFTLADGTALDTAPLLDDDLDSGWRLPLSPDLSGELHISYPEAVTVRTLDLAIPGLIRPFRAPPIVLMLEMRGPDGWQLVNEIELTNVPNTLAFAPVTAREFRLRIIANPAIAPMPTVVEAPGAVALDVFGSGDLSAISINQLALSSSHRLDRAQAKAGFSGVNNYYDIMSGDRTPASLSLGQVIDLSDRVAPDGTLDWTPPAGNDWVVLDFGWSLVGTTNHPAPPEATGLEVDKFDPAAVRRYMETYLGMYRDTVGDELMGDRGLRALVTDSIESGFANWTPQMEAEFAARRGYALRPWLPALTGMVINSEAETERFLFDWRETLAELLTDHHYGTVADVAHENGLIVYGEALESNRPLLGDDLSMRRHADIPMAAFWTYPRGGPMRSTLVGDMRGAASTAHVYGQTFVAAESMTSTNAPWAFAPRDLRRIIDLAFVHGINRPVIHTSVHQPLDSFQPGITLAIFGQHFNRHETWAEMAEPWVTYMARTAWMLQQGEYVADIAWFRGEEAPLTAQFAASVPPGLPSRFGYDFVNADMLHDAFRVEDGMLVAQGGTRYRVLFLGPDARHMTLPTLQRISDLVGQGATLVGRKPEGSPSLADDAAAFTALADTLWRHERVIDSNDPEAVLARLGVVADFAATGAPGSDVQFLHRKSANSHIYFMTNRLRRAEDLELRLRVTGMVPEFWDAMTGTARPLTYRTEGQHTVVSLSLAAEGSGFVVFREATTATSAQHPVSPPAIVQSLAGQEWQVRFQPGRGAPEGPLVLDNLRALDSFEDTGIRYFSGTSTYTTELDLPVPALGKRLWLDLGQVGDVAQVWLNGEYAGTSWFAPDRVDITAQARPGANRLEIRVANLWVNRLIGDAQPGTRPITATTAPTYRPDAPLRPSGLIGPVTLMAGE